MWPSLGFRQCARETLNISSGGGDGRRQTLPRLARVMVAMNRYPRLGTVSMTVRSPPCRQAPCGGRTRCRPGSILQRRYPARPSLRSVTPATAAQRFKCTTISDDDQPVAANLLDRQFNATAPNRRWLGDTTAFVIGESGKLSRRDSRSVLSVHRRLGGQCRE
jgi:transposase InsO family protein